MRQLDALEPRRLLASAITVIGAQETIVGIVYNDLNADGRRQGREPTLAGWPLLVTQRDGDTVRSAVTNDAGQYAIADDPFDSIQAVQSAAVRRWRQSGVVSRTEPGTHPFELGRTIYEIGVTQRALVSGIIFNDLNGDGAPGGVEPSVRGWQVFVDDNDNRKLDSDERSVRTNSAGRWTFSTLPGGHEFNIRMLPQMGLETTFPAAGEPLRVFAHKGQVIKGRVLGVESAALRGYVFNDLSGDGLRDAGGGEPTLPGWRVWLDLDRDGVADAVEPATLSDAGGLWTFSAVPQGSYRVRIESRAAWPSTSGGVGFDVDVVRGQITTLPDFGKRGVLISGSVFHDTNGTLKFEKSREAGLEGQRVYIDRNNNATLDAGEPSVTANRLGRYYFTDQSAGSYTVRLHGTRHVVSTSGSGGVTIQEFGRGNDYGSLFGWFLTSPTTDGQSRKVTATAGASIAAGDFGLQPPLTVRGRLIFDADRDGVADADERLPAQGQWKVFVDEDADRRPDADEPSASVTHHEGHFELPGVRPGAFTLRAQSGLAGFANDAGVGVVVAHPASVVGTPPVAADVPVVTSTLRFTTFDDANGNGLRDLGEAELPALYFLDANDNGIRDDGVESAINDRGVDLPPGRYIVRAESSVTTAIAARFGSDRWELTVKPGQKLSHGFAFVAQGTFFGGAFFYDDDADGTRDFDEREAGYANDLNVEGFGVWLDLNDDARRDSGEPLASMFSTGEFLFPLLPPGTYRFRAFVPPGWRLTTSSSVRASLAAGVSDHRFGVVRTTQ